MAMEEIKLPFLDDMTTCAGNLKDSIGKFRIIEFYQV